MFVWKVQFSLGDSGIVNNAYNVTSGTLTGALKKAKRMDDEFTKECFDGGDDPEPNVPMGITQICRLDE